MAKAAGRKLKVFQARLGFYDTVLAVPSQAAALRAWGTTQNMFASGEAKVATDEDAVAAALAHPETVLRRPIGSSDAFAVEPKSLPNLPDLPAAVSKRKTPAEDKPRPVPPKPPDRSKLNAAEAALRALDKRHEEEESAFRREEEVLRSRLSAARSAYAAARKAATTKVAKERSVYRNAGGA